jgi:tRNA dimethylallyltransferase
MSSKRGSGGGEPLLAVVGPTASGKTEAALELAASLGAEIVSVDSMLVYRGMDVGTAKPTLAERARVPHHLIDVADPEERFSVARYQSLALEAVEEIRRRGRRVLLAGGSGLYYRAVVDRLEFPGTDPGTRAELEAEARVAGGPRLYARLGALDPPAASKIEPANVRRTVRALEVAAITGRPFSAFSDAWDAYPEGRVVAAGIELDGEALDRRVRERVRRMIDRGFVEEVRGLLDRGLGRWLTASQAIGYLEIARHLEGLVSIDEAVAGTVKRTKALARRQTAWFRRDPRIRWFAAGPAGPEGAAGLARDLRGHLDR